MKYIKLTFIIVLIITIILLLTYKKKNMYKEKIIVKETDNYIINIILPETKIIELDNKLNEYILNKEKEFLEIYADTDYPMIKDQLTINYKYTNFNNKYLSISLETKIKTYKLEHELNEVKTYFYDIKKECFLNLKQIINTKNILINNIRKELNTNLKNCILPDKINYLINDNTLVNNNFYIDKNNIIILYDYIDLNSDYYDILEVNVPLNKIKFNIKLNTKIKTESSIN